MTKKEFEEMFIETLTEMADEHGFSLTTKSVFITDGQISLNVALYGDVKGIMDYYSEINQEEESSVIQIDSTIVNDNDALEEVFVDDLTEKSQAV